MATKPINNMDVKEPNIVTEALSSNEVELWKKTMIDELTSKKKNKTWRITTLPPGRKPNGNGSIEMEVLKWSFKIKPNSNGSIFRYKTRLVAKGFSQTYMASHKLINILKLSECGLGFRL